VDIIDIFSPSAGSQRTDAGLGDEAAVTSNQRKKRLLGLLGCGLLIIGVFLPIISMPIVGSFNYIHNGRGDGIIVLALAVISGLLILGELFRGLVVTGLLALAVMCFTLCQFFAYLSNARAEMARSDNIFKGLGEAMLATVQIQWGWVPLVAGGFLVLAAGILRDELHDTAGRIIPVSQTKAWSTLAGAGALMAVTVMAASWLSPDFLRNISIPALKSESPASVGQILGSTSTEPKSAGSSEPHGWQYSENSSEMDGKKSAFLSLAAEDKIPGLIGEVTPTLHIRCRDGKAELFINTDTMVEMDIWSNTNKVRIKFDEQQPAAQKWSASTDRQALFAPNVAQLIKQLSTAQLFLFEFMPFNKSAQVVKFNVAGLDTRIGKIAEACPKAELQ